MIDLRTIAYFSMEIALEEGMPTYSGGLGVLAGDTIRSASSLRIPMVAISLIHRKGYFFQLLDENGLQKEEAVDWNIDDFAKELPNKISLTIEGRNVQVRAWKYTLQTNNGFNIPVYLLDSDLPENSAWDRELTHYLYGGDAHYRLCQEAILGIGGVRMLRDLGYSQITRFHLNEGHASLLTLELLDEACKRRNGASISFEDINEVRKLCVFTTHTPVEAGHDKFSMELVNQVLGRREIYEMKEIFFCEGILNMTYLALNLCHYVNGVAKKHGEISQLMFARYPIDSITNGVNVEFWTCPSFAKLFDKYIPGWKEDNYSLRYALSIPKEDIWNSHTEAKSSLISLVNRETNLGFDQDVLTIGFARRATTYKRADLLLRDIDRLRSINAKKKIQIIFSGKAHPKDQPGKQLIQRIFQAKKLLKNEIKIAYLPNYDIELAKLMTSGVDIWLNTPLPPNEASGTSGMKAALNGVPSLSTLDGWWVEGCIEGITGWAIKNEKDLLDKLENVILPLYYDNKEMFTNIMMHSIAINGSFFNTQRMVQQYVLKAYFE